MAALGLVPGRRVLVRWDAGEQWQARILVATASVASVRTALGVEPAAGQEDRCWECLTPDLDLYPHLLAVPPLQGLVRCDAADIPDWDNTEGNRAERRGARRWYGDEWCPTPLEFFEALQLVTTVDFVGAAALPHERVDAERADKAAREKGAAFGSPQTCTDTKS